MKKMKTPFYRRISMLWFYPIILAVIAVFVILFALLYTGGGALILTN